MADTGQKVYLVILHIFLAVIDGNPCVYILAFSYTKETRWTKHSGRHGHIILDFYILKKT